jgi:NTP pyrophosphatase (non-canonical NTP hydrolase)
MAAMNDGETTLQDVKDTIAHFTLQRDWRQFHSAKNLAMALVAEAAELMAHFRWNGHDQDGAVLGDAESLREIRHELADVLLLLAEFANVAGIDMAQAVQEKMAINAQRYPVEKSRGTARKYNRL